MNENELHALIQLLDDPDEGVFDHVRVKFLELGLDAVPHLENNWELAEEILVQQRIENLIHSIKSHDVFQQLKNWKENGGQNLLNGAILVAKYHYHNIDEEKIRTKINQIKQDVWISNDTCLNSSTSSCKSKPLKNNPKAMPAQQLYEYYRKIPLLLKMG